MMKKRLLFVGLTIAISVVISMTTMTTPVQAVNIIRCVRAIAHDLTHTASIAGHMVDVKKVQFVLNPNNTNAILMALGAITPQQAAVTIFEPIVVEELLLNTPGSSIFKTSGRPTTVVLNLEELETISKCGPNDPPWPPYMGQPPANYNHMPDPPNETPWAAITIFSLFAVGGIVVIFVIFTGKSSLLHSLQEQKT
jgi:hypothetical protein